MKLDNIPLSRKLWLTVIAQLLVVLAVTQWTQARIRTSDREAAERLEHQQALVNLVSAWITMSMGNTNASLAAMASGEPAVQQLMQDRMKANRSAGDDLEERVQQASTTEADKAAMAEILQTRGVVKELIGQAAALKKSDAAAVLPFLESHYWPAVVARQDAMQKLLTVQNEQRDAVKANAETRVRQMVVEGAISVAVAAVLSLLWVATMVRSISRRLRAAVCLAEEVAAGNLVSGASQTHAERRDEIGDLLQAMSRMSSQLCSVVIDVRRGVGSVATASSEIAAGNLDLSARTEQTASSLQQTVSSLEQLAGTVSRTAVVAQQVSQLADSAAQSASCGGAVVGEVVSSMDRISEASRKIGDIIGVIDGIAFQTNILALNAAVEAARAGEQGRGFAVVAGEVRMLAQRSTTAAREIKTLIGNSVEAVEVGARQVGQSREVMGEIVASVSRVSALIAEMSQASDEGRSGIRQVNAAVEAIDRMTQQNAALVEESSAAAGSLRDQAERLTKAVAIFLVEA